MKLLFTLTLCIVIYLNCYSQVDSTKVEPPKEGEEEVLEEGEFETEGDGNKFLSALVSYNFSGNNNSFSNLTPIVDYGWSKSLVSKTKFVWDLSINPYVAGQINIQDSSTFMPALMLPGVGGIRINSFLRFPSDHDEFIIGIPCFGFKLLSNFSDSVTTIAQHNLRTSFGYRYEDLFLIGIQYTWGWHNLTSESENSFRKTFSKSSTDFDYITVTLQTKLTNPTAKAPTYLFLEWRSVINKDQFEGLANYKILTIGIRADLNLERIAPAAIKDGKKKLPRLRML